MKENDIIDLDSDFVDNSNHGNLGGRKNLPNSVGVLVLGIISIVGGACYGIVGLITGIIALVLFKTDNNLYKSSPGTYNESSYKNSKAGQVCAIIGLALAALWVLFFIFVFAIAGTAASANGWR